MDRRHQNGRAYAFFLRNEILWVRRDGKYKRTKVSVRNSDRVRPDYFGCTFGLPPGEPGGGMTFSSPPAGGVFCISGSMPAGGHMMPFDSASLSLSDWDGWLRPTVGGSPFTSGGQSGGADGRTSAWANAVPAEMMLVHRAIETLVTRKR
jgi:hypothetical protein